MDEGICVDKGIEYCAHRLFRPVLSPAQLVVCMYVTV